MSDTTEDTTTTEDPNESFREKTRRDHFPIKKGDNQQDLDYGAEDIDQEMADRDVKWPEVTTQEELDAKIDEEQSDKDKRIIEAAREADADARAAAEDNA